ncbi:MAG: hypothetical protein K2X82_25450, partial [Gemmataceae bacterium]|nr:hypothetical protein [Gemmataceae bacterium]
PPAVAPPPRPAPDVAALKAGLVAALGPDFEYLGGELGRAKASIGTWAAERFWYARVRPTKAGHYAVGYEVGFDFGFAPDDPRRKQWNWPERGVYIVPIAVGAKGEPRQITHGSGGVAYPHANVGDTLLIPVHVDWQRVNHTFRRLDGRHPQVAAFFSVYGEPVHDKYIKDAANPSPVTNRAADKVKQLAGWGSSIGNRPGTSTHHSLRAYLEFTTPGEFALAGRLADDKAEPPALALGPGGGPGGPGGARDDGVSFRVVPKDRPVTVVLEHVDYGEHTGRFTTTMTSHVGGGTPEVRVGDRMPFGAGEYHTGGLGGGGAYRPGVVEERPFKAAAHYTPEPGR